MAIAFNTHTFSSYTSSTSKTHSHTCTGSDLVLTVFASHLGSTLTGITYNGTSMTSSTTTGVMSAQDNFILEGYYLINPDTGANSVVVSYSGAIWNITGAQSYTGADQSAQPNATSTNGADSYAFSATLSTDATTMFAGAVAAKNNSAPVAGTGETVLSGGNDRIYMARSTNSESSGSPTWDLNNIPSESNNVGYTVLAIKEAAAAPTFTPKVIMF